jgi:hypothetical protein
MKAFRAFLDQKHAEHFSDIEHFRQRLTATLRQRVDDLLPAVQPGSGLAKLILAVNPAIRDCMQAVTDIVYCKQVHDSLHDLRQKVIRRLREEFLPRWVEKGALNLSLERFASARWAVAEGLCGYIRGALKGRMVDGDGDLGKRLDELLAMPPLWDPEAEDARPTAADFAESLDNFAAITEAAFSAADRAMRREEPAFNTLHTAVLHQISAARLQTGLSLAENQTLDDEVAKVAQNKRRFSAALSTHHVWQGFHDEIMHVLDFQGTTLLDRRVKRFAGELVDKLRSALKDECQHLAEQSAAGPTPSAATAGAGRPDPLPDLLRLEEALKELKNGPTFNAFEEMRGIFDNVFYALDKRTLDEVKRSRDRVAAMEKLMEALGQSDADAGSPNRRITP